MLQRCAERSLDFLGGRKSLVKNHQKEAENFQAYIGLGIGHIPTCQREKTVINGHWVQSSERALPSSEAKLVLD